jgi:hypothetical protein
MVGTGRLWNGCKTGSRCALDELVDAVVHSGLPESVRRYGSDAWFQVATDGL